MREKSEEEKRESNGIEVYLRIRPSSKPSGYFRQDDVDETQFIFQLQKRSGDDVVLDSDRNEIANNTKRTYGFKFNGILDDKANQEEIFRSIGAPAVRNVLDGYNSTVFAYGQTGSGKTFTITGGAERYADRGVIPRAISMLFSSLQNSNNVTFSCFVSYFELYNENGYDLLAGADDFDDEKAGISKLDDLPKITMLEDEDGNYHFRNLSVNPVSNEEEALNLLFIGDTNRAIGETQMNQSSSRSHCIFTIMVEMRKPGLDTVVRSKLNLVDLAGSERVHKTNSSGQTLKEAQYINSSLFFLEMVIIALYERTKRGKEHVHVPYRNSMMTSVLRDSLGGNCKTVMIATISPEVSQTDESISTCHFAQRVALVKNNAFINEELEPELVIQRLKGEIKRLREEIKYLKGENGEEEDLTEDEDTILERQIRDYLTSQDTSEMNIGTLSLARIKASFVHFKNIYSSMHERTDDQEEQSNHDNSSKDKVIQNLLKTVRQRDEEIKILVKMVKEGKKSTNDILPSTLSDRMKSSTDGHRGQINCVSDKTRHQRKEANVCGVEHCKDGHILTDPSLAFNWFQQRYRGLKLMIENKEVLQDRFNEAKSKGELVKKTRETIQLHKQLIEKIRREAAIDCIGNVTSNQEKQHPKEIEYQQVIEKNKKEYQEAFHRLRELRSEIEHIKHLVEKGRTTLQKDFDTWYECMCNKHDAPGNIMDSNDISRKNDDCLDSQTIYTSSFDNRKITASESSGDHCIPVEKNYVRMRKEETLKFQLPQGARLTGNKETDEDIIAFYKAKEALCARNKARLSIHK